MDKCVLMLALKTDIMGSIESNQPCYSTKIPHFVVKMAQKVPYLEKIST